MQLLCANKHLGVVVEASRDQAGMEKQVSGLRLGRKARQTHTFALYKAMSITGDSVKDMGNIHYKLYGKSRLWKSMYTMIDSLKKNLCVHIMCTQSLESNMTVVIS